MRTSQNYCRTATYDHSLKVRDGYSIHEQERAC